MYNLLYTISGALNPGVPQLAVNFLSLEFVTANPKSASFTLKFSPTKKFYGLISLCDTYNLWQCPTAFKIILISGLHIFSEKGWLLTYLYKSP